MSEKRTMSEIILISLSVFFVLTTIFLLFVGDDRLALLSLLWGLVILNIKETWHLERELNKLKEIGK